MTYVWLAVAACATFVVGTGAAALCVLWLPADYFESTSVIGRATASSNPIWDWAWFIGRNVLGAALVFAGFVMLFIPGPGLLAVLIGVALVDFPGKHRLVSKLLARPHILTAANHWRQRFHKPPLRKPAV